MFLSDQSFFLPKNKKLNPFIVSQTEPWTAETIEHWQFYYSIGSEGFGSFLSDSNSQERKKVREKESVWVAYKTVVSQTAGCLVDYWLREGLVLYLSVIAFLAPSLSPALDWSFMQTSLC